MKQLLGILIATIMITASQASTNQNGNVLFGNPIPIVTQRQTATPNVPAHAKHKKIVKSKVQRAIPFGMDDDDDDIAQSDDIATGYRRRDLTKVEHPDGISEKVRWRLFLARQMALFKFREKFG